MQDEMKSKKPNDKRSFSTMTRKAYTSSAQKGQELTPNPTDPAAWEAILSNLKTGGAAEPPKDVEGVRSKFLEERGYQHDPVWRSQNWKKGVEEALPAGVAPLQRNITPDTTRLAQVLPAGWKFKERYDPLIEQFVGLMIRDGKKAKAERVCFHNNNCRFGILH